MGETTDPFADPGFIEPLRARMVRFARLQLRDDALAEDAVQEALVGALRNAPSFSGRSAFATWVFGILKNKITDALRSRVRDRGGKPARSRGMEATVPGQDGATPEFFDGKGMWKPENRPARWGDPHDALENAQFWRVFEACLDALPENQARIFMMRQILELDSQEICETAGLSVTNLHVILHRARLRLRACLEGDWFRKELPRAVV